ncbi:MAG: RidA family protein [Microbacterium sp.]
MNQKIAIASSDAPTPFSAGHYSPAIIAGGLVFVSGQGPILPDTKKILRGSVAEQAELTIDNLSALLTAAGSDLTRIVKATIYLSDLADWGIVDQIWGERVGGIRPARSTVGVSLLAGMDVEIDVIAFGASTE